MNTKRHSLGTLGGLRKPSRGQQQGSLPKTVRMSTRESIGTIKQRIDDLIDRPIARPESRSIKLPPMTHKLMTNYLTKPVELSVVSSDDGSRFLEGIQQQHPSEQLATDTLTRRNQLVGQQAITTFYTTYKNLQQRKRNPQQGNKQTIQRILQVLEKYEFPPERMRIIKEKGEEDILFLKGYGMLSSRRNNALEEITQIVGGFKVAILSNNSLVTIPFLKNLTKLVQLDLSGNHLSGQAVKQFKTYFERIMLLEELNLENNFLFDSGAASLVEDIMAYTRLRRLNLSRNGLAGRAAKAIKELLSNKTQLLELYLHWNELDEEAGREIFLGLESNRQLKVLDLSWNYLGGKKNYTRSIAQIIPKLQVLIHLDLSFCGFTEQDSKLLAEGFRSNHVIYGLHFQGNFGYVNHKGFLIVEETDNDVTTKLKYPLPVSINYGLKRIHGCDKNNQRYHFRSDRSCKDVCWICESWVECVFQFDVPAGQTACVFFNFQGYEPVKISSDIMYRLCPRGDIFFFFSRNNHGEFYTSDRFQVKEKSTDGLMVRVSATHELKVNLPRQNTMIVDGRHPIDKDHDPEVYCQPRNRDQRPNYRPPKKQKPPPPVPYKQLRPFDFSESPLSGWKNPSDDDLEKCIEFDFAESKLTQIYEQSENLFQLKQALKQQYAVLLQLYYHLAAFNRLGNSYYINPPDLKAMVVETGMCDKRFPQSLLTVVVGSVLSKIHEVELDVDYSPKKVTSGYQTISRPKFVEFIYRAAAEKYCRKLKQYQLDKLAKRPVNEQQLGKVTIELVNNDSEAVEPKVLHVRKDRVLLPIKEAVSRVCKQFEKFLPNVTTQLWRESRVWSPEACLVLQTYQTFVRTLYLKFHHNQTRLRIKTPGMYFEDWIAIFPGMMDAEDRVVSRLFMQCKMVEIEEGKHPPSLQYPEFLESLVRVAELLSLPPQLAKCDLMGIHPTHFPISFKLENLVIWLHKKNPDLTNKFIKKTLEKGGIFEQELKVYFELAAGKADCKQPGQPFELRGNQITLESIISQQRLNYERALELSQKEEEQQKK